MENSEKIKDIIIFVLALFTGVLIGFFYHYYSNLKNDLEIKEKQINNLNSTITNKTTSLETYKNKVNKYEKQIKFMDNYVAICPLDGSGLYHKYGCEHLNTSNFVIYNINQAPNEGYSPCYYCSELDNTNDSKTEIVYVTDTGSSYHHSNCSYLHSKNAITKENAIKQGYSACSRCKP